MKLKSSDYESFVSIGELKLSFNPNGLSKIVAIYPDENPEYPKFHIIDSEDNDLGWVGVFDTNHSSNLIFTEADKNEIIRMMNEVDDYMAQRGFTDTRYGHLQHVSLSHFNNFEDESKVDKCYNMYKDLSMPDYNQL